MEPITIVKLGWRQQAGLKAAYEAGMIAYRSKRLPHCFEVFPPLEALDLVCVTRQRDLTLITITPAGERLYEAMLAAN